MNTAQAREMDIAWEEHQAVREQAATPAQNTDGFNSVLHGFTGRSIDQRTREFEADLAKDCEAFDDGQHWHRDKRRFPESPAFDAGDMGLDPVYARYHNEGEPGSNVFKHTFFSGGNCLEIRPDVTFFPAQRLV